VREAELSLREGPGARSGAYLVVTLKPGKTEQILLSEEMLPVARQFLDNYKRWWAALEQVSAVNRRLLRLRVGGLAEPQTHCKSVLDQWARDPTQDPLPLLFPFNSS
jgi:hypothetical protein